MNRHSPIRRFYAGLTVTCLFALVLSAFAHRTPSPLVLGYDSVDVSQYVLPDGTLPVLCTPSSDGTHQSAGKPCDFCAIAKSSFLIPPCVAASSPVDHRLSQRLPKRVSLAEAKLPVWPAPPTGPPARIG